MIVAWWWVLTALAAPTGWEDLADHALDAWRDGPGEAVRHEVEGVAAAGARVPLGPTGVRAEVQWGSPSQEQVLTAVQFPLGLGLAERRAWAGAARAASAREAADRWAWVEQVHQAYGRWWLAAERSEHLAHYQVAVAQELEGLAGAVEEGLLAPLDLEDLQAEAAWIASEAASSAEAEVVAGADVQAFLGERPVSEASPHHHDELPANPWPALAERVSRHPTVVAAQERAEAVERARRALGAARRPVVEVGPMWAPDEQGQLAPLLFAGVELPLQPGVGPSQRAARGEVAAAQSHARWEAEQVRRRLVAEAEAYDAALRRVERLQSEVVSPLELRQGRLEQALREGLVSADRVVRARRERHEAEHELLEVTGSVLASAARAAALTRMWEEEP